MRKIKYLLFFTFTCTNIFSQIGIGTTSPDLSSSLDISSSSSGLLIPRVNLIDVSNGTTPVTSPANSLLVYNTNSSVIGGNGSGYYYWNGTIWTKLFTSFDEKWSRSATGKLFPTTLTDFVGIGTNNPQTNLHLVSNNSNPVIFDGGNSLFITLAENGSNRGYFGSFAGNPEDIEFGTYAGNLGSIHLTTNNTPKLTVLNGGNIGIGTTNPTQKLDVQGGNARINNSFVGDVGFGSIWANFSHQNQANVTGYGFLHSSDGNFTLINKQNTGTGYIGFRIGNIDQAVITNSGNMGIGTTTPSQKVDIIGKIKITDGSQGVGKLLSSDANGVGTWVNNTAITPAVIGTFTGGGANIGNGTPVGIQSPMTYCNVTIVLPPGKWIVFGTYLLAGTTSLTTGQSVFVRTTLSESNVFLDSSDIISGGLVSGTLIGPCDFGLANGQTIIYNNTLVNKPYYLWANVQKFGTTPTTFTMAGVGSNFWSENQLSAIPTN
ncbi:hypothetical protein [Flavobacterium sp.]|uniref:hypothetical protein n=1 Tax=Flavobacterium sp. TaxID=239 RepID=UPI0026367CB4|nr:hypothetical protein [Flavobacterium sp.]